MDGVKFCILYSTKNMTYWRLHESNTFLETLNKSFDEWKNLNPETALEVKEGKICTLDKQCK